MRPPVLIILLTAALVLAIYAGFSKRQSECEEVGKVYIRGYGCSR